ncbi:microcystin-dependent protein [Janthinobacterium sp. BJB426]|nr:microcystin-dependent protein [Janthinobacterium sp. BJB426]
MADVYLGQIMMGGFNFAPRGFAACNGQLLPVAQNQALFALLGTYYGGNGSTTFALPNLQGSTPVGAGGSVDGSWQPTPYQIGTRAGVEAVTLISTEMPPHTHAANAVTTPGTSKNPTNTLFGGSSAESIYGSAGPQVTLSNKTLALTGGNQAHNNMQPFSVINFNIALSGIFPSRN